MPLGYCNAGVVLESDASICTEDIAKAIQKYGIIGSAAGSLFVFKGKYRAVLINYPSETEKGILFKSVR